MQRVRKKITNSKGLTSKEKAILIKLIDNGYSKVEIIDYGFKEMNYLNLIDILEDDNA